MTPGSRVRVLVTNDDGIEAPGLAALAAALVEDGFEVVAAAPPDDRSGSGAAIGPASLWSEIPARRVALPGLPEVVAYAVDGPPALAVIAALLGAFGDPPALVASGINPGPNTGQAVLHSGTVGAVLTAANFGSRGVAVSLADPAPDHRASAQAVGRAATRFVAGAPLGTVLNVNVPSRPLEEMAGIRWARLSRSGVAEAAVTGSHDSQINVSVTWWTPGEEAPRYAGDVPEPHPDDDTVLLAAGYVTVTPIAGVRDTPGTEAAAALARALDLGG